MLHVQEVLMLPGFIRLADYMVVEGLMLLAVGTGDSPPLITRAHVRSADFFPGRKLTAYTILNASLPAP